MENAINRGNCADSLYSQQISYKSIMRPKYLREREKTVKNVSPNFYIVKFLGKLKRGKMQYNAFQYSVFLKHV